jgi:hypothetical protein
MYLLLVFKVFLEALRINILLKKFCGEEGGNEEYYLQLKPNYKSTFAHTKM